LRNVFIPTPDPSLAPQHPADPHTTPTPASSLASSTTSLDSKGNRKSLKVQNPLHGKKGKEGKLTDYINTLEIANPEDGDSKEAVVVLHGYAAALG
jgi:cardiolipin-specific phospholipase